ncbi:hypothetical protein GCM10008965_16580 [Methylorubrum aminovorans]
MPSTRSARDPAVATAPAFLSLPKAAVPVPMLPDCEVRVTVAAEIVTVSLVCSIEPLASIVTLPDALTILPSSRTRPVPVETMLMSPLSEP